MSSKCQGVDEFAPFKKFENILKSKVEPFPKKIESLIEIWKSLGQCNQQNSEVRYIVQIMDWAKLHTLNIVLTGKWKMFKADFEAKLLSEVEKTQGELMKISDGFSKKFQKLADVIKNPWDDPILANLLHDNNATIGQQEIEFFCIETAYLVSVRLKKLCESQCEDLALNLVTAFMNCYNLSQAQNFNLNATKTHILFCFDIHVALLYRYDRRSEIVELFKKLTLEEGLQLIRRFAKKRVKISKVWRNYPEITSLASQVFVTAAVTKSCEQNGGILKDLLEAWITFSIEHSMLDKVETSVRRIIQAATAAQHIYICCEVIHEKFGLKLKTFTIELYIRALTTDMNNLESQKTENDKEKVDETMKRLANGFHNLADILKDNIQVSRECALTAFSLDPTLERLRKIEDLARLSGFNVLDTGQIWECKLHAAIRSSDEICWICNSCGKWMCNPNLDLRLQTNFALNEALNFETLGISPQLCDDLAVVLNGPRYQLLSWLLRWEDLHRLCEMYLNDLERTKNLVTELKFVDIDYSMFATVKREPVDEMAGIERGYEKFLYSDEKLANTVEDSNLEPPELPQAKSDPNTLKTLRMFRHNVKRNKPQVSPILESNNVGSSSQNIFINNWLSDSSFQSGFNTGQQELPECSQQQSSNNVYNQNVLKSFSDVFFNSLTSTEPTTEGAVDYSSSSRSLQKQEKNILDVRDFPINLNKRKPTDSIDNNMFGNYQNFSNFTNSDDMHKMIASGFARINPDMKRSKPSDFLVTPQTQSLMRQQNSVKNDTVTSQSPSIAIMDVVVPPRHSLQQYSARNPNDKVESETLKMRQNEDIVRIEKVPPPRQSICKIENSRVDTFPPPRQSLGKTEKVSSLTNVSSQSETLRVDKVPPPRQSLGKSEINMRSDNISTPKHNLGAREKMLSSQSTRVSEVPFSTKTQSQNDTIASLVLAKYDKIFNKNNLLVNSTSDKVLPQSTNSVNKKTEPYNLTNLNQKGNVTQSPALMKEFKNKETEAVSPSKDFPNFDKIPSPPVTQKPTSQLSSSKDDGKIEQNTSKTDSILNRALIRKLLSSTQPTTPYLNTESSTKNDNFPTSDQDPKANLKRSKGQHLESVLEKRLKLDESSRDDETFRSKNGGEKDLNTNNKIIRSLLTRGDIETTETSVQNENSSKNANCCLPTNNINEDAANPKNDCCKKVINGKTPIIQSPQCMSSNNNNHKNVPQVKSLCCKKPNEVTTNGGIGKADNICDKEDFVKCKFIKEINQSKSCLLKSLSETHIPIIVDDLAKEKNYQEVKLTENNSEINNDLFKYEDTPKLSSYKELKIILHRLSAEVIRSFIPSYTDAGIVNCSCSNFENKKRPKGRPKKLMCCRYKMGLESANHVFERIDYEKYPVRMLRNESDKYKKFTSVEPRRDISDIEKKTGPKKINNNKHKKILGVANEKRDDSDKLKKPKKDFSDKDKKIEGSTMNPRVILERLPSAANYVRSVLSNVPGLNDYEMIRPGNVNHIVNVVQISGGRTSSTGPVQNTQTSTQITPHIQRIGQPRSDKPEHNTNSEAVTATTTPATTSSTTIKPSTSQPSTLINILSQQIIRPGQSNCVRNRTSPLINILSQQIIRPATTQINKTTTEGQNNPPKVATTTTEQSNQSEIKTLTTTAKPVTNAPSSGQGTILQFICKSTLPKFQQAFGKSVYQNNTETGDAANTVTETTTNTDLNKKNQTKNASVNIQPIQGGVIYTRQMPVGQTINLIPPGRGQVFRIAASNSDQISLVKDTVIHSKMSALLAAALQGKQKTSESQSDGENTTDEASGTRVTVTRPTLVQNARIVKPVLQIPTNVIRTSPQSNLSSTTLEQLREFDMVYKQIKERSSTSTPSEANTSEANETSQRISVTYVNQGQKYTQLSPVVVVSSYCNLQPAASPALSVTSQGSSSPCVTPAPAPTVPKVSSKGSKGKTVKNTTTQASKASPIPKPQQKPQEDEHTTQRIFDILAEYAEQLRNSPDLNNKPAPRRRSNPPTNPSQNSKRKKSSGAKKSGQSSSMVSEADIEDHRTVGSEDSSCGVVQISVQEEEQSHIQAVATESNDSSSGTRQQLILTDASSCSQPRNLIIADSSVGEALKMPNTAVLVPGNYIMPVSMVKGGQQIAVVSGGSKILATVPARSGPNMLLFQSFLNQNRNKSGVPTVKYSTIQPIAGISSQTLAGVSGQPPVILPPNSHNLTAVTLGQPLALKKLDEADRVNTELLLTISQPRDNGNSSMESVTHPDSTSTISSTVGSIELEETIIHSDSSSEKVFHTYQKSMGNTAPIATPVIAQTSSVKEDSTQNTENSKNESTKTLERVQSVLVTACTSNGPMLSHTPPRYRKPSESTGTNNEPSNKEEFLHNGEKQNNNEQKQFQGNATYFQTKTKKNPNPQRLDRELHQLCLQRKQAALERELRLQKSLSEECEDLGVDEPSTSDLFPEADILFDSNHSPSFDQSSQDLVKRSAAQDIKEENKSSMTLFSDDDNSSSLRTDFLFEPVEYQTTGPELEYEQNQQLTNGQSSASNESASSCEDHTLLQNCASMSDVTLNSPVSPDPYHENTPPSLNKYKFKYSNRRKGERHKQSSETWTAEVSSSEDTTGSTELGKSSSHSPESCTNKRSHSVSCDEELSDGSYKVVRVAISKSDLLKDDESCEELHCEDDLDCSPSGRGARRSVKKMCSCCNGSQDGGASRKRPTSRPHTPAPHKKAFLNKKR